MSRSYRKTLRFPNGKGTYEHEFKKKAQRALRRNNKLLEREIETGNAEDPVFFELREVSDVWCFPKDGKRYSNLNWIIEFYQDVEEQLRQYYKTISK